MKKKYLQKKMYSKPKVFYKKESWTLWLQKKGYRNSSGFFFLKYRKYDHNFRNFWIHQLQHKYNYYIKKPNVQEKYFLELFRLDTYTKRPINLIEDYDIENKWNYWTFIHFIVA